MFNWILELQVVPVYIELGLGVGADEDGGVVVRDRIPTLVHVQCERPQVLAEVRVSSQKTKDGRFGYFMEVTSILGKTHFRRVLFPVGKHMRGGAENNEASPRHLPALLSRKYNTPPGQLRPPPSLRTLDHERRHK